MSCYHCFFPSIELTAAMYNVCPNCNANIHTKQVPPKVEKPKKIKLLPEVSFLDVITRDDIFFKEVGDFVLENSASVIHGMAKALKFQFEIFSMTSLVESHAEHIGTMCKQYQQPGLENFAYGRPSWNFEFLPGSTSLVKFVKQQMAAFNDVIEISDDDTKLTEFSRRNPKQIVFAAEFTFTGTETWIPFINELKKVPSMIHYDSECSMLPYLSHAVPGINGVKLHMLAPGARRPCHQRNSSFCTINFNVGAGSCEWFVVEHKYTARIQKLVESKSLSYTLEKWWPDVIELNSQGIPVYRFSQKPGDMVWVNSGSFFWTRSLGSYTGVEWNYAPISGHQYQIASANYSLYTRKKCRPPLPMVHLSWLLGASISTHLSDLYEPIKACMKKSLVDCAASLDALKCCKVSIYLIGRPSTKPVTFCENCHNEIFNLLLVSGNDSSSCIVCVDCAREKSAEFAGFDCLQERSLAELESIYDQFQLLNFVSSYEIPDFFIDGPDEFVDTVSGSAMETPMQIDLTYDECLDVFLEVCDKPN